MAALAGVDPCQSLDSMPFNPVCNFNHAVALLWRGSTTKPTQHLPRHGWQHLTVATGTVLLSACPVSQSCQKMLQTSRKA